ncbi:MAG: transposase [Oscillospiraceae bacterium]|nr:transposase [Oscillospiraceae bacterium]
MVKKNECMDEDRFPNRKSPRIPGYDYATPNYYFITICTHQKKCLFWSDHRLNPLGQIAYDAVMQIPAHFPKNWVDRFVIMPNHIHMILVVEPGGADTSVVVGSLKSYVTRQVHQIEPGLTVWQTSYHDHGIRSRERYQTILQYIETNPIRWEKDCFYVE